MRTLSMHHDTVRATGLSLSLKTLAMAAMAAMATWNDRARERRMLGQLDDRMLADVGLTRAQVWRETGKGFWER
ncbi:hypothetical protein STAQ_24820 [Allostella sp. ATCC 35155]|nr:hypothetical protein STAQ_24820 [Stella sp. ATCC 35155]